MFKILGFFCLCSSIVFGENLLEKMTLEEKVGQVLMVHFHGEVANEDAKVLVQEIKVGGIIYYNWSNGLHSPEQILSLSKGLQKLAQENSHPIPLLIAVDQEGGVVSRLQNGFTQFPGNRALGETEDPSLAQWAASAMGKEMHAVGVNMNLAPVVDINSNPQNPIIGIRSFGETPDKVIAFGGKALEGYRQTQIISTLKHFPGHGDTSIDSHEDLPVLHKSQEELKKQEFLPFAQLSPLADAIMTAHILVPALDPENCATLSEKILTYLREQIGFQGVIVSDSLVMEGVLKKCSSIDEVSIKALSAGCDLLILGGKLLSGQSVNKELDVADIQRIHTSIVAAVKSGRISESRLNAAVANILALKKRYLSGNPVKEVKTFHHRALSQKIASAALEVVKQGPAEIFPLSEKKLFIVAPQILENNIEETSFVHMGESRDFFFFETLNPLDLDEKALRLRAENSDVIIVFSYNAWKNPKAAALNESLLSLGKPCILLSVRDPLDASLFSDAATVIKTFSPSTQSIQAVCDQLLK